MSLFEELIEEIKTEAVNNPNQLGWRFLLTSKRTLDKNNGILLVSFHPGGNEDQPNHSSESYEKGCAYLDEKWPGEEPGKDKLQVQIQLLFKEIASRLGNNKEEVMKSSVCAHFIPFRSPNIDTLKDKERTIEFSKNLWRKLLSQTEFEVIFCLGKETYKSINNILTSMSYNKHPEEFYPTGWGNYKACITPFQKNDQNTSLVYLPHPSIFFDFW